MSTSSPKQKYLQLKNWLPTLSNPTSKNNKQKTESRLSYYQKKGI
tara:strand:- start:51 stop:185 length:135 start_codon:yes stop_codon:yes gene_type:complete